MGAAKREVEIKFRVENAENIVRRLNEVGAQFQGRYNEENRYYDDALSSLQSSARALRLRFSWPLSPSGPSRPDCRLTLKEPIADSRFKVRDEIEVALDDGEAMAFMLERLGYHVSLAYRKERALWQLGSVLITVDHLSLGDFVELEATPDEIEAVAVQLGLDLSTGMTQSYLDLIAESGD